MMAQFLETSGGAPVRSTPDTKVAFLLKLVTQKPEKIQILQEKKFSPLKKITFQVSRQGSFFCQKIQISQEKKLLSWCRGKVAFSGKMTKVHEIKVHKNYKTSYQSITTLKKLSKISQEI